MSGMIESESDSLYYPEEIPTQAVGAELRSWIRAANRLPRPTLGIMHKATSAQRSARTALMGRQVSADGVRLSFLWSI
jgi:hypothetical protein